MKTKNFKTVTLNINDLVTDAKFYQKNIETIFIPLLEKLSMMQKEKGRRLVVFLAAAPGAGKSTLVSYLQLISQQSTELTEIQSVGLDGFHFSNTYLETHHLDNNESLPLLKTIKGSPASFDVYKLLNYTQRIKSENIVWPIYSRNTHDVCNIGALINQDIILIEGNYLLLNLHPWDQLKQYADYTIFINVDKLTLKNHLINRKHHGGSSMAEAESHYEYTDAKNINTTLSNSIKADLTLLCNGDMEYRIIDGKL